MNEGKVYLVGAGPGKPDLITVRGSRILQEADVVVYDYLADGDLLGEVREGAELICGEKNGIKVSKRGERISDLLVQKAKDGKRVVRLKNGDPAIFGRCSQELEGLVKNKIEFEIVPGVTAASAVSAFAGVPLTDRRFSSSVVLVTGRENPQKEQSHIDWEKVSSSSTIVLYMAVESLPRVVERLLQGGKSSSTPVVVISKAGDPNQRVVRGRLKDVAEKTKEAGITPPAIFIIGPTAGLGKDFDWLGKNKRVLFTGLSRERFFIPGTYFHLPLIEIKPLENYGEFDAYLKKIEKFDWLVFTSRYGAKYFFDRLHRLGFDGRNLSGIHIAAIGGSTKEKLLEYGIIPDLVPEVESSRGLIEAFQELPIEGEKIFLPRSDISDKGLEDELEKLGAEVRSSFAYRNVMPEGLPDLDLNFFDEVCFTSPSTVRNFKKRYQRLPAKVEVRCIGEVTLEEARRCRLVT